MPIWRDLAEIIREGTQQYYGADERLRVVNRRTCLYFLRESGEVVCDPSRPPAYESRPAFEEYLAV